MDNPFAIWVLYTYRTVDSQLVCQVFGFGDEASAKAIGDKLAADPIMSTQGLKYMVLQLEAPPL